MNDMRDRLEPTLDELFDALEPLRAEPETFAEGVAGRLDGRESEPDDTALRSTSEWPTWMQRAASIAPPGAMGALGVAKASTTKLGTAAVGVGWATPIAALLVAALGVFAATFRLRGDRGDGGFGDGGFGDGGFGDGGFGDGGFGDGGFGRLKMGLRLLAPWLFLAAMVVPTWLIFTIGVKAAGIAAAVLQVVCTVAIVRVMSAVGRANRATLGGALAVFLGEISFFHLYFLPQSGGSLEPGKLAAPLSLVGTAWLLNVIARRSGWTASASRAHSLRLSAFGVLAACLFVFLVMLQGFMGRVQFGSSASSIVGWMNRVDAPADDLGEWRSLGRAKLALESEAFERVDLDRLRATISAADDRIHPMVTLGALRLGVLQSSEFRRHLGDYWLKRPRFTGRRMGYAGEMWLKIAYLQAEGLFEGELRDAARTLLEKSWPDTQAFMSIEHAAAVLELAEVAGFEDLVEEKLPELPAFLQAAWVGRRLAPYEDCGFEALHIRDDGHLVKAEHSSNSGTSFAATVLLARLVEDSPDALEGLDIDLTRFLRYLDGQRGYFSKRGAHAMPVDTGLARHLLLRTAPLPRPSTSNWILAHGILLSTLLSCAIALTAMARAPTGGTVWDGP